jgi:hypothetical protein
VNTHGKEKEKRTRPQQKTTKTPQIDQPDLIRNFCSLYGPADDRPVYSEHFSIKYQQIDPPIEKPPQSSRL